MAAPQRNRIGEILVKAKVIDELQLRSALAHVDQWGGRLTAALVDLDLADDDVATEAISSALGMQRVRLGNVQKDLQALSKLDVEYAESHGVFPIALRDNGKTLHLAMADPTNVELLDEIGRRTRARVVPHLAGEVEINHAILRNYRGVEPPPRDKLRRTPGKPKGDEGEEEEFKITDMAGKTVMKRLADIDPGLAQQLQGPAATPPGPGPGAAPAGGAGDLLDELMGAAAEAQVHQQLSEADVQRLETVRRNQDKSAVILRALQELLAAKGYQR